MDNKISKQSLYKIPEDVQVFYNSSKRIAIFKGSAGTKSLKLHVKLVIKKLEKLIYVTQEPFMLVSKKQTKKLKSLQGTTIALIKQIILEISVLLCCKLKLIGVGYKVFSVNILDTVLLQLRVGYSHSIYVKIPKDMKIFCLKSNNIFVFGNSYYHINYISSIIRAFKVPDSYKGKGILYDNEKVKLKVGKKV